MTFHTSGNRDRPAAFFAAAIFAALGPTQYLGAFATYDAMALFLMTAAAWCVVAARDHADSTVLLLGGAALLALANATKYATGLFDPVIIALAALSVAGKRGVKPALGRGGYLAVSCIGLLSALLAVGGPLYVTGVLSTTLARANGGSSPLVVMTDSARWIGAVCLLAALAVAVAVFARHDRVRLINYLAIAPSIIYNMVVFPAWHRCRFGLSGFMAKFLYGWAHMFCLLDIGRGRRMGWQATGAGKRKAGIRRVWIAIAVWNVPACRAWVLLALWRMSQYGVANFVVILATGVFASVITGMALASRRNYARRPRRK